MYILPSLQKLTTCSLCGTYVHKKVMKKRHQQLFYTAAIWKTLRQVLLWCCWMIWYMVYGLEKWTNIHFPLKSGQWIALSRWSWWLKPYENNQQEALRRLIYYSKSALHVSGDVFARHQEHLFVFTVSGSVHPSCCRVESGMSFNSFRTPASSNLGEHYQTL